jgi:hypothetical protein
MEILEHLDQHQASDGPVAPEEAVSTLEHHRDGDSRSHAGLLQGALRLLRRRRSS